MKKEFTCIICPVGCEITVEYTKDKITKIEGNTCDKGAEYVKKEITNPERTLTTTLRVKKGELRLVSVRTSKAVPKKLLFEAMDIISEKEVDAPVKIGDVLIKNILNTGADVIATKHIKRRS